MAKKKFPTPKNPKVATMYTKKASKPAPVTKQRGTGLLKTKGGKVDSGDTLFKKGKKGGLNQS